MTGELAERIWSTALEKNGKLTRERFLARVHSIQTRDLSRV
jgi:hypothetical protein